MGTVKNESGEAQGFMQNGDPSMLVPIVLFILSQSILGLV